MSEDEIELLHFQREEKKYRIVYKVAVLLLIIGCCMYCYVIYERFFKKPNTEIIANTKSKTHTPKNQVKDSLKNEYTATLKGIDSSFVNNISLDKEAQPKLLELNNLKSEISDLLKAQTTDDNLESAKLKIEELKLRVAILQNKYTDVDAENKRLQNLLNSLLESKKNNKNSVNTTADKTGKIPELTTTTASSSLAADLHLYATTEVNTKDTETSIADDAEKITGSFVFKNASGKGNGEIMIVVLQPNGRVIKNATWESGLFETSEGKKVYSRKMLVEPNTDEKRLNFSLTPDTFQKGNYTMQVWYNGNMIAKTVKVLS
ncbi:MAG: hypothetical protein ABL929_03755 [Ferruginibacter sp.]|nr:hypothetical protein [Ferruginibacter sp.]